MKKITGFWISTFFGLLNKLLGFIKVMLEIKVLGDHSISDAFFQCDRLLAVFRRIFTDGSFDNMFLSYFFEQKENNRKKIAFSVLRKFGMFFFAISASISIFSSLIIKILNGLLFISGKDYMTLESAYLLKTFLIYTSSIVTLMFLMSFFTCVLNANKRFGRSSMCAPIANSFYILFIWLVGGKLNSPMLGMIVGSISYALIQVIFMVFFAKDLIEPGKEEISSSFISDVRKTGLLHALIPISDVINNELARSLGIGFIAYIEYAHKIIRFIYSILSASIGNIASPILAEINADEMNVIKEYNNKLLNRIKEQKTNEDEEYDELNSFNENSTSQDFVHNKNFNLEDYKNENKSKVTSIIILTHILAVPVCIFLILYAKEFTMTLLQGAKKIKNPLFLSETISVLGYSLYFYIINRILNSILISKKELNKNIGSTLLFAGLNIIFSYLLLPYKHLGLAWASNISVIAQFSFMLYFCFSKKFIKFKFIDLVYIILSLIGGFCFAFFIKHMIFYVSKLFLMLGLTSWLSTPLMIIVLVLISIGSYIIYLLSFWRFTSLIF